MLKLPSVAVTAPRVTVMAVASFFLLSSKSVSQANAARAVPTVTETASL